MKKDRQAGSKYIDLELYSVKIDFNQKVLNAIIEMIENQDDDAEVTSFAINQSVPFLFIFKRTMKTKVIMVTSTSKKVIELSMEIADSFN